MTPRFPLTFPALCLAGGSMLMVHNADACSSCGCTLNTDWGSQGYHTAAGLRIDLRQDYYDQDQLRSGTRVIDRSRIELPSEQEIQLRTVNRNTILTMDYSPTRAWALQVQVPYFNRTHSTLPEGETEVSASQSRSVGDVRLLVRYQGWSADASIGVQAGLKLPTGATDVQFVSGPALNERVDRGLQPGTGTTDLLLGVYRFGRLGDRLGYSAQALVQQPLNHDAAFQPGTGLNLTAGLRYLQLPHLEPQLQLNVRVEGREQGTAADHDNSGATLAYLSPGVGITINAHWQSYGFVQLPLYQRVNGLQIEPGRFYSLGLHYTF